MSRIGKILVILPKNVKTAVEGGTVRMEGPKGKLSLDVPQGIQVNMADGRLVVERLADSKQTRADQGTTRAHLLNMITGVTEGHKKELEILGVGFRVQMQENKLVASLGFSHPVEFEVPKDVTVTAPKPTSIIVEGTDKVLVGQTAACIRRLRPPEPYKGKGIRYLNEAVRRKQGKTVTK